LDSSLHPWALVLLTRNAMKLWTLRGLSTDISECYSTWWTAWFSHRYAWSQSRDCHPFRKCVRQHLDPRADIGLAVWQGVILAIPALPELWHDPIRCAS
jgi:hypothetical protein